MAFEIRTRNPEQRPVHMTIHRERGPSRHFEGKWRPQPLEATACKVEFLLNNAVDSHRATRIVGPGFDCIANTLVDAFVRSALSLPEPASALPPAGTLPVDQ